MVRLRFGSTTKRNVATETNLYKRYWGNPLPESCVRLFITLCIGYILKKRTRKITFAHKLQKNTNKHGQLPYIFPQTPDQSPLKGVPEIGNLKLVGRLNLWMGGYVAGNHNPGRTRFGRDWGEGTCMPMRLLKRVCRRSPYIPK